VSGEGYLCLVGGYPAELRAYDRIARSVRFRWAHCACEKAIKIRVRIGVIVVSMAFLAWLGYGAK